MTSLAPFSDDDPFLPRQDAPHGLCEECGEVHRLDMGCGPSITGSMRLVAVVVVAVLLMAGLVIWGTCS